MDDRHSRLRTIDGLRGVAALGVVFYHVDVGARLSYGDWTPAWVTWLLHQGALGVDVFFVISGFVIAYSVRAATYTPAFLGVFALRRFIRLDPPYWAAIALEIALIELTLRLGAGSGSIGLPSVQQILAHVVYAQHVLGLGDIVPVFWTLCYEIQFYLFFVGALVLGRSLRISLHDRIDVRALGLAALGLLFVVSVLTRYNLLWVHIPLWLALNRWFQFFLGVLVWWVVAQKIRARYLIAAWAFLAAIVAGSGQSPMQALPIAVSALLWISYARDQMASFLSARPWQFLGAISYSLYLFHSSIGWRVVRAPDVLLRLELPPLAILGVYLAAIASAILFSWVAWQIWERPFQRLSRSARLSLLPGVNRGDFGGRRGASRGTVLGVLRLRKSNSAPLQDPGLADANPASSVESAGSAGEFARSLPDPRGNEGH
jgi:peptidoglycan/LPS O-acetylase OafA/YrhL